MKIVKNTKYWPLLLMILPCVFGWLGYTGHGFIFKAAVAGSGILFLLFFYRKSLWTFPDVWFIIAAFAFSIVGDWFLSTRHGSSLRFIYGIFFFFIAHAGYLCYSLWNGRINWILTILLLAVYLVFFVLCLYPSIKETTFMIAVLLYLIISCFSLGAAVGTRLKPSPKWVYFFGISMVLFSDTIIAFREFTEFREYSFLILPTYYLAQIGVTMSLLLNKIIDVK